MPSEATITQDLTFKAADEIAASGRRPTLELVRAQLAAWTDTKGGSYATLGPWLRMWKEQQRAAAAEPVREAVPPAVAERVAALASDLWAVASEMAVTRLAGEREAMNKARNEAEAETAEALELAERLTEERDAALIEAASLREQLDQAKAQLVSSTARAEADVRHLQRRVDEHLQQFSKLRDEHSVLQVRLRSAEDAAATHRQAAEQSASAANHRAELLSQLDKAHAELQGEHRAAVEAAVTARAHLERIRAELQAAGERERRTIEEAATARGEAARLSDQLKDQKGRSADVIARLEASKQRIESELTEARFELRKAAGELGKATGELDALRAQVAGQSEVIKGFATAKAEGKSSPTKKG